MIEDEREGARFYESKANVVGRNCVLTLIGVGTTTVLADLGEGGGARESASPGTPEVSPSEQALTESLDVPETITTSGGTFDPTILTKFIGGRGLMIDSGTPGTIKDDSVLFDGQTCVRADAAGQGAIVVLFAAVELPDGAGSSRSGSMGRTPTHPPTFRSSSTAGTSTCHCSSGRTPRRDPDRQLLDRRCQRCGRPVRRRQPQRARRQFQLDPHRVQPSIPHRAGPDDERGGHRSRPVWSRNPVSGAGDDGDGDRVPSDQSDPRVRLPQPGVPELWGARSERGRERSASRTAMMLQER